jgi:hypothetical protein
MLTFYNAIVVVGWAVESVTSVIYVNSNESKSVCDMRLQSPKYCRTVIT